MRVLLRARAPFFSSWGVEMLVMQLYDQSRQVAMEALSVLSEACEEEVRNARSWLCEGERSVHSHEYLTASFDVPTTRQSGGIFMPLSFNKQFSNNL